MLANFSVLGYGEENRKEENHVMGLKSKMYKVLRIWNDVDAVRKGRIGNRIGRRVAGRAAGKVIRKIFK